MKNSVSQYLEALTRELSRLPGIGHKSATRMAFHILDSPTEESERLIQAIKAVKENIKECAVCGGISDSYTCNICTSHERNHSLICVVETKKDILTIEKTGYFSGVYHVLGGVISPLDGIGPDELNFSSLEERCKKGVEEVIMATNPTVEGDATVLYASRILKPLGIRVMRLARGLPVGADIDFADMATITKSLTDRHEI